jgi:hypothetical protein
MPSLARFEVSSDLTSHSSIPALKKLRMTESMDHLENSETSMRNRNGGCSVITAKITSHFLGTKSRPTSVANQPPAGLPLRQYSAKQSKSNFQLNKSNPAEPHSKIWTSWRTLTFYSEASDFKVFKMDFEYSHFSSGDDQLMLIQFAARI